MEKSRSLAALRVTVMLAPLLTAACAGGGAAGSSQTVAAPSTANSTASTTTTTATPSNPYQDTGIAGLIAAPGAATYSSATAQIAAPGGPTFDGSGSGLQANVSFPLLTSSLQATSAGLSATAADHSATATVVSASASSSTVQLIIPSVNVNSTFSTFGKLPFDLDGYTSGLSYVIMGEWGNPFIPLGGQLQSVTEYVFGYETPSSSMPTTGSATFSGTAQASVFKTIGTDIQVTGLDGAGAYGKAAFSVNFASGQVNGAFTNMQYWDGGVTNLPWNDVSVTANIASGTNRFSGDTAAASAPAGVMSLSGSATGHIDGAFYGPAAQNLGAVWSLSDGSATAIGTVVAGH